MKNIKINAEREEKLKRATDIKEIKLSNLFSDPSYQRNVNWGSVSEIAKNMNRSRLDMLKVSFRGGKYYVMDGQHRLLAVNQYNSVCKDGEKIHQLLCQVFRGLDESDEAYYFRTQRLNSLNISTVDNHRAALTEGNEISVEIDSILNKNFVKVVSGSGSAKSCGALKALYAIHMTNENLDATLSTIRKIWGYEDENMFKEQIIKGMSKFLKLAGNNLKEDKLIKSLRSVSALSIIRNSKDRNEKGDKRVVAILLEKYNKGCRDKLIFE